MFQANNPKPITFVVANVVAIEVANSRPICVSAIYRFNVAAEAMRFR